MNDTVWEWSPPPLSSAWNSFSSTAGCGHHREE
jgi:hypothetical protein